MEKPRTILKRRFARLLRIWNRLPFRAQGGITVFIPVVAVLISFCFAIYGNRTRAAISEDIGRKFTAVRQYSDLLNLMLDAETGERGYLLTRRREYLAPYAEAVEKIPQTVSRLKETIEAEPGDKPRLERIDGLAAIQNLIDRQLAVLKQSQDLAENNKNPDQLYAHLQNGKSLMDEIRENVGAMQNREETLLAERLAEVDQIRKRDYIVIFITLIIGILVRVVSFYLFDRGIVRRVERLTEYVAAIIKGNSTNYHRSKKTDAVGALEEKIVELVEKNRR